MAWPNLFFLIEENKLLEYRFASFDVVVMLMNDPANPVAPLYADPAALAVGVIPMLSKSGIVSKLPMCFL